MRTYRTRDRFFANMLEFEGIVCISKQTENKSTYYLFDNLPIIPKIKDRWFESLKKLDLL